MRKLKQFSKIGTASTLALLSALVSNIAQAAEDALEVRIPVQVFADVGAFSRSTGSATTSSSTSTATPERNGAFVGSLTLFTAPQLGDHVRSLFELLSEFNTAGTNVITVERAQIGYVFNDAFTIWGGRFHSPYGYWNTAYHHGAQLQPSIARPVMLSGALPAHTIGLWATGQFDVGASKLTYDVYGGNSTRVAGGSIDPNHTSGDNKNKNIGFNLGYNAGGVMEGLRAGIHGLRGKVTECASVDTSGNCAPGTTTTYTTPAPPAIVTTTTITDPTEKTKVTMVGAYTHYENYNVELIAEYYRFKNTNLISTAAPGYKSKSSSGFVQIGYVLGSWIPFIRYEETDYDPKDEFFKNLSNGKNYSKNIVGVRHELNSNAVLKTEFAQIRSRSAPKLEDSQEVRVQYAIRF